PARYVIVRSRGGPIEKSTASPVPSATPEATMTPSNSGDVTAIPGPGTVPEEPSPEPTPRREILPSEYENSFVAMVEGTDLKPTDPEWETVRIRWEDDSVASGPVVSLSQRIFKLPRKPARDIPPELDGLIPGYTYYYQIFALDSDNVMSEPSYAITIPWMNVPAPPANLSADVAQNRVTLTWSAPERDCRGTPLPTVDYYEVYRAEESDDISKFARLARVDDAGVTEYTDSGVASEKTYHYRVRAMMLPEGVPGEYSETVPVDTTDRFPPDPPASLTGAVSGGVVHLNWRQAANPDLAGYIVYRKSDTDPEERPLNPGNPVRGSTYSDDSVESGRTYVYSVSSVDTSPAANESGRSNPWSITIR
ncbi:MAG TPA: fibronectin type III domain-containing protein, partial [bacterium]|nr:fibronectin type III domain-containing protein [bacterium]